jgi:sugar fermentation stimulation protein A
MQFNQNLKAGRLIRRYKRFLADVEMEDGSVLTVHCPNSGSMLGCSEPGSPVMISRSDNPGRKYPHTLEMVKVGSAWVGVNTSLTNKLVREALESGVVQELGKGFEIFQEVKTSDHTRLDFLLEQNGVKVYMEVKNCSLAEHGTAMFPDAVTAVFFCVQREDADVFSPAAHIDPLYAETLAKVEKKGVLVLAYQADVSPLGIKIIRKLPVKN